MEGKVVVFSLAQLTDASFFCLRQDDKAVGRADRGAWPAYFWSLIVPWEAIPRNQLSVVRLTHFRVPRRNHFKKSLYMQNTHVIIKK